MDPQSDARIKKILEILEEDYAQASYKTQDKWFEDKYAGAVNAINKYQWYKSRPAPLERQQVQTFGSFKR